MHVAATNPLALTADEVDPTAVAREKDIFAAQARESGKSENIIEKMVEGRMRKFYEEVVLLKQAFVLNPDMTVEQALKAAEKDIGAEARITGFVRFALGAVDTGLKAAGFGEGAGLAGPGVPGQQRQGGRPGCDTSSSKKVVHDDPRGLLLRVT